MRSVLIILILNHNFQLLQLRSFLPIHILNHELIIHTIIQLTIIVILILPIRFPHPMPQPYHLILVKDVLPDLGPKCVKAAEGGVEGGEDDGLGGVVLEEGVLG